MSTVTSRSLPSSSAVLSSKFTGVIVRATGQWLSSGLHRVKKVFGPDEITTASELMALANYYEATQPSLAADLRAAAMRGEEISA